MDKVLSILKVIMQLIPLVKKMFPKQTKNLPDPIDMTGSVWDKKEKK